MRHLGIDFGTRKVGLALSDEAGSMGFPHAVLPNNDQLLETIVALVKKENVGAIVIGDSKDSDGNDNPVAAYAKAFAGELTNATGLEVAFELEAYTTQEARRAPDGTLAKGAPPVDASAAALILTSYLSRHE